MIAKTYDTETKPTEKIPDFFLEKEKELRSQSQPEPVIAKTYDTETKPTEKIPDFFLEKEKELHPQAEPEPTPEPVAEPEPTPETVAEPETDGNSHLFAVRTTGGQEKIVMRLLEARIKMGKINIQSVVLLSDLKGYVVVEAQDVSAMFDAIQGIRHVRGQLRGELTYNEIDKYLIKKSTVSELAVENTVEIIGGPFKGMKATITRVDQEKEEATVILLDATYQLPVTVDANYLKLVPA